MEKIAEFEEYRGYTGYAFIDKQSKSIVVQIDTEEADVSSDLELTDKRDLNETFKFTVDNFYKMKARWQEEDFRYGR